MRNATSDEEEQLLVLHAVFAIFLLIALILFVWLIPYKSPADRVFLLPHERILFSK